MPTPEMLIRSMTEADIPRLAAINATFTSPTILVVERTGSGLETGWRLVERELPEPFDKGDDYDFDHHEQANVRRRLRQGDGLHLVVERGSRLVGVLDVTPQNWNHTAWIWNIMLDVSIRGQGVGRDLFARAARWSQQQGFRALVLETQTNNVPACKFYLRMGCTLEGVRTALYTNDDIRRGEVAIFWVYPLA